ncbi:DUF3108 domain-containing protein [Candidatus Cardinium sp. TP]|uniref:DUF3108 domain-containing protein n=1 Tax=Candidatus Cardinium sp. TP TaxID=2961955 RepID=UPI0021AFA6BD|nr:DUF3108 domain-containing protein [Candidatus Cardinium sp. TP]MCT4697324.1 DUF3108 domain-containing protein [Candidatus Cardinium sp. TP]MDN5247246.1 DUF3108 domain-containing protein [Candidatus Cardinium sp.]
MVLVQYLKKFFLCSLMGLFLSSVYAQEARDSAEPPFRQGEWLEYQVYYGAFIHAGTATMCVDEQLHKLEEHVCYKIHVQGTSSKALDLLGFKVLDRWETYLDVDKAYALRPHRCVTHLQENGYLRKEQVDFDYQSYQAKVEITESSKNMECEVNYHPLPNAKDIKDLIGGYYALRSIDTTKLKPGDKLILTVLHDQQLYEDVGILFLGKKTISTKLGKTSALVFAPLVPIEDSIFSGTRPVEAYISDDVNKVPLKLKVNLVVGTVEIELTNYKGLKEDIHFQPS